MHGSQGRLAAVCIPRRICCVPVQKHAAVPGPDSQLECAKAAAGSAEQPAWHGEHRSGHDVNSSPKGREKIPDRNLLAAARITPKETYIMTGCLGRQSYTACFVTVLSLLAIKHWTQCNIP